jgi:predicted secreted protein
MKWTSLTAIYFVTWFLVLFAVLPFGVHTQEDAQERVLGTPESAPAQLHLVRTAVITTIITAVLVGAYYYCYAVLGYDTDWLARKFGVRPVG